MLLETIAKYWVTWLCGLAAGAFVLLRKRIVSWYKTRKEKQEADEYADRYILYLKLGELFRDAQDKGYITIDDMNEAEICYKHYHALGGNGRATKMLTVLKEMEVR